MVCPSGVAIELSKTADIVRHTRLTSVQDSLQVGLLTITFSVQFAIQPIWMRFLSCFHLPFCPQIKDHLSWDFELLYSMNCLYDGHGCSAENNRVLYQYIKLAADAKIINSKCPLRITERLK